MNFTLALAREMSTHRKGHISLRGVIILLLYQPLSLCDLTRAAVAFFVKEDEPVLLVTPVTPPLVTTFAAGLRRLSCATDHCYLCNVRLRHCFLPHLFRLHYAAVKW